MQEYKKPSFNLYRIVRMADGKAFNGFDGNHKPYFVPLGQFFRTENSVRKHLIALTREWHWTKYPEPSPFGFFKMGNEIPSESEYEY